MPLSACAPRSSTTNSPETSRCVAVGDQHRAGCRGRLHPRGDIGRVAEDVGVLAGARAHHHRARIDADPRGQLGVRRVAR